MIDFENKIGLIFEMLCAPKLSEVCNAKNYNIDITSSPDIQAQ
jgi:hypothetical protein